MKNIKVLLLVVVVSGVSLASFFSFNLKGQKELSLAVDKYKVIRVNGHITFDQSKSEMKSGDYFVGGTALSFENQYSRAAVISKTKGRFVLSGSGGNGKVKILPAANNVSSRSGAIINAIDLKNHFSGKMLVIDKLEVEIGKELYPQNESNFFYVSYDYNGELIRKKMTSNGDKLMINKEEIFMVDGKSIVVEEREMVLYYRSGKSSKRISAFTPVFPDKTNLKTEVQIIIEEFDNKDDSTKVKEIEAYLTEFYGKTQKDNVSHWLLNSFNLK